MWLALAFVLGLLILPISADALVDIVRYVQGPARAAPGDPDGAAPRPCGFQRRGSQGVAPPTRAARAVTRSGCRARP